MWETSNGFLDRIAIAHGMEVVAKIASLTANKEHLFERSAWRVVLTTQAVSGNQSCKPL